MFFLFDLMGLAGTRQGGLTLSLTSVLPEPGQVVEVRGSSWAVANVQAQGLPRSPADEASAHLNHVVELQSLDEDRLGEQLSVIWELEVGQTVTPAQGLPEHINPDAFDDPVALAGFVDAMRWGAVTSADPNRYQAPFWSGAAVEAYQLEPLRRALASPRANLLLADDVGLGKTIEAGLVLQELLLRHRARTAVIVCPPSLALKWQDEMRDKFGLHFVIVNSALMAEVRRSHGLQANPFLLYPRVIVSMAWLPKVRAQRLLRDVYAQTASPNSAEDVDGREQPRERRRPDDGERPEVGDVAPDAAAAGPAGVGAQSGQEAAGGRAAGAGRGLPVRVVCGVQRDRRPVLTGGAVAVLAGDGQGRGAAAHQVACGQAHLRHADAPGRGAGRSDRRLDRPQGREPHDAAVRAQPRGRVAGGVSNLKSGDLEMSSGRVVTFCDTEPRVRTRWAASSQVRGGADDGNRTRVFSLGS